MSYILKQGNQKRTDYFGTNAIRIHVLMIFTLQVWSKRVKFNIDPALTFKVLSILSTMSIWFPIGSPTWKYVLLHNECCSFSRSKDLG